MKTDQLEIILSNTYTKRDVYRRLRLTREYLEESYFVTTDDESFSAFMKEKEEKETDFKQMKSWGKAYFESFSRTTFYKTLERLKGQVQEMPAVALYVPFISTIDDVEKIGEWVRENVNELTLVDVRFDPHVIGGCAVVWDNTYHDYSMHYYFEENKQNILSMISRYGEEKDKKTD